MPPPPEAVSTYSDSTSITVSWDPPFPPNGVLTSYVVELVVVIGSGSGSNTTVNASVTMQTFQELLLESTYSVRVAASTEAGMGEFSSPVFTNLTAVEPVPGEGHTFVFLLNVYNQIFPLSFCTISCAVCTYVRTYVLLKPFHLYMYVYGLFSE